MKKTTMLVGQQGVKYGLQTRQPAGAAAKQPAGGRLAAFGADSDSDEDIGQQVQRQAARKVADSKVQDMYAAALAEDPTAFDYDGVYESLQEQKAAPKQRDKVARQPKYIASLLAQAEVRKREQEITFERQLLKERKKEDHLYENQEKFVTAAYRRKLEEDKKWQESQRLRDMDEERNDVTKLGHMNNFFHNLTKNVALGGEAAPSTQPAAAASSAAAAAGAGTAAAQPPGEREGSPPGRRDSPAPAAGQQQEERHGPREGASPTAAEQPSPKHEQQQQQQEQQQQPSSRGGQQQQPLPVAPPAASSPGGRGAADGQRRSQEPEQKAAAAAAAVGGKRKNDDAAVAAARERYLARKRQQGGA